MKISRRNEKREGYLRGGEKERGFGGRAASLRLRWNEGKESGRVFFFFFSLEAKLFWPRQKALALWDGAKE